jgi:uncharacterized membrane protein
MVKRHLAKTISYRLISSGIGFTVVYVVTGSIELGAGLSAFELIFKPALYFLHERFWYKYVKFGLKKH